MDEKQLIKAPELAMLIDSSVQTISSWYRWKKEHPDHELAQLLPEYVRYGNKHIRYWNRSDVGKFIEFKTRIPKGRNGIMGDITQKYVGGKNKINKEV